MFYRTDKFRCEPPLIRLSEYNCFNCSIPGAPMNMTYGMNSVLLWSIFNAFGAQSKTHILPEIHKSIVLLIIIIIIYELDLAKQIQYPNKHTLFNDITN